jgi:high-affinity iron transporter
MSSLFSVPLFFIIFRETLEASIIISVLLSLVENLVEKSGGTPPTSQIEHVEEGEETYEQRKKRLVRRMRIQVSRRVFARCGPPNSL